MGFTLNLKAHDSALIRLENAQDVKASFMQAVENALKRRVIKFEVDIAQSNQAIDEILSQILALQKVLAKRGEKLVLRVSGGLNSGVLSQLNLAGVDVQEQSILKTQVGEDGNTIEAGLDFPKLYQQAKSQLWPKLEHKFLQVYEELRNLMNTEVSLQKELEFYKKRILLLRPSMPEGMDFEGLVKKHKAQSQAMEESKKETEKLQSELGILAAELQTQQSQYREMMAKLDPVSAKKYEIRAQ